jgi:hypothetical protein
MARLSRLWLSTNVGGGPRKIRRPFQSEQLPASRGRPAVARSCILDHEPKPAVGDEIPHA